MSIQAPYGSWESPLTSKIACDSSVLINGIYVDTKNPGRMNLEIFIKKYIEHTVKDMWWSFYCKK